jgi:hypothetical protein
MGQVKIKVNEAIAHAQSMGKKILKKDLAAKIWSNSNQQAQAVNMTNLCSGVTKKVNPEWLVIISLETGCSIDFLLGLKEY